MHDDIIEFVLDCMTFTYFSVDIHEYLLGMYYYGT